MTEQEEFEFQLQLEKEAAASQQQAPTTFSGAMSEINKGIGRGLTALPLAAGEQLAKGIPQMPSTMPLAAALQLQPDENVTAFRQRLLDRLKATPANRTEQMLGTGAELGSSMLPFTGGAGTIPQKLAGLAAPTLGGVAGEQVAQDIGTDPNQGKMIGSFAGPLGMAAAGRALAPNVSPDLKMLIEAGARPTPGQQTGGFLKRFENYPLVKEITSSARSRSEAQYVTEVVPNLSLKPLGAKIGPAKDGFEAFEKAERIASQAYDDVLPKLTVKMNDPQFWSEVWAMQRATPRAIKSDLEDIFTREVVNKINKSTPIIEPRLMKEIDSALGQEARKYSRDPAVNSQNMADRIRDVQGSLRDMVARQNPANAPELTAANQAWNNLLRMENATNRASANNGNFTPRQYQESVKTMDSSLRRSAFAKGQAAMQDVSRAGVKYLGDTGGSVPYGALSNAARYGSAAAGAGAAGYAAVATGTALPLAAAAAGFGSMYTPLGQRLAQGMLSGQRPMAAQTLGNILREAPSYSPATLPLFADFIRQKQE